MKYKLIFLLSITILISGCINTGSNQPNSGGGMEISDFTTMPKNPEDTDEVSFLVEAKNTGSITAECVRGDIYGLGGWRNLGGQYLPGHKRGTFWHLEKDEDGWSFDLDADSLLDYIGLTEWAEGNIGGAYDSVYNSIPEFAAELIGLPRPEDFSMDNFDFDISWEEGEGIDFDVYWNVFAKSVVCNEMLTNPLYTTWSNETFYSKKADVNEPGQLKNTEWVFIPPDLLKGARQDFEVIFRLTYTYKTTGTINFPVKTDEEIERSGPVANPFIKDESRSPVTLSLMDGEFPITPSFRDYQLSGERYEHYPLTFQLKNIGNGFPIVPFTSKRQRNNGMILGWIKVEGPGVTFSECLGETDTNKVNIEAGKDFQKIQQVKLRSDGRSEFGCTIKLDRRAWENRDRATISVVYRFGYVYSTDKTATVSVKGT